MLHTMKHTFRPRPVHSAPVWSRPAKVSGSTSPWPDSSSAAMQTGRNGARRHGQPPITALQKRPGSIHAARVGDHCPSPLIRPGLRRPIGLHAVISHLASGGTRGNVWDAGTENITLFAFGCKYRVAENAINYAINSAKNPVLAF